MHALVPVTHRTTEHAAVKSALMGDGEGREDGTRTSDCRGVGEDAHSVISDIIVFGNNGSEKLVEVAEEERPNTCDIAWQNKHWTNELA
jgi:hypothetical protein